MTRDINSYAWVQQIRSAQTQTSALQLTGTQIYAAIIESPIRAHYVGVTQMWNAPKVLQKHQYYTS